jgi:hypothetical protein
MLLEALNQPDVISITQQSALVVKDIDFNFAFRFVRKHTRLWEFERKRELAALKSRLLKQTI